MSRLADPPVAGAPPGRWWPPAMLDPDWIARHRAEFDVMHVHFGVESLPLKQLEGVIGALRRAGRPLVHTVHDLTHPQLADQHHHLGQLRRLVAGADALVTLTPGAAREIAAGHGRSPVVIPHPAMRPAGPLPRVAGGPPVIGIHLRDLRPGIDGPGMTATLAAALDGLPGVHGRIQLHERVRDEAAAAAVRALCDATPSLALHRGPRPDDAVLEAELSALAVSLLPYRHGTHSGWLEHCWDLGVPVAAPAIGHFAEQHPDEGFHAPFAPGDPVSLRRALARLLTAPEATAASPARATCIAARAAERARARTRIAAAHRDLYRDLVCAAAVTRS